MVSQTALDLEVARKEVQNRISEEINNRSDHDVKLWIFQKPANYCGGVDGISTYAEIQNKAEGVTLEPYHFSDLFEDPMMREGYVLRKNTQFRKKRGPIAAYTKQNFIYVCSANGTKKARIGAKAFCEFHQDLRINRPK